MTEILFASKKGGTGKSTLCSMVANHLALSGKRVIIIDGDNCNTLTWRRKSDNKILSGDEQPPYSIISYDEYIGNREKYEEYDYILLDNHNCVSDGSAGIIVIPFIFSEMVLDSTFKFIKNLKTTGREEIVFVPNEVAGYKQAIKKKDTIETIKWILGIFGKIMPKVGYSRVMEQASTIRNTVEQNLLIRDFIDTLFPDCPMQECEITQSEEDGEVQEAFSEEEQEL